MSNSYEFDICPKGIAKHYNLNLLGLESNRLMKDDGIEIITDDNMRHVNR